MKSEISSKRLAVCAREASVRAEQRALALGVPVAKRQGNQIVRLYPDGHTEVIQNLRKPDVRPLKRSYNVGHA